MDISTKEAFELIKKKNVQIIDVRTKIEFSRGHLENCIHIDYYSNNTSKAIQKLNKSKTYVVCCGHGERSHNTAVFMKSIGFKRVYNLSGGITKWIEEGYPITIS